MIQITFRKFFGNKFLVDFPIDYDKIESFAVSKNLLTNGKTFRFFKDLLDFGIEGGNRKPREFVSF